MMHMYSILCTQNDEKIVESQYNFKLLENIDLGLIYKARVLKFKKTSFHNVTNVDMTQKQ